MRQNTKPPGCRSKGWVAKSSHGVGGETIHRNPSASRVGVNRMKLREGTAMKEAATNQVQQLFDLSGRVAIVTGGAGLLGYHHGAILAAAGAHVVLLDLAIANPALRAEQLQLAHGPECLGLAADITNEASLENVRDQVMEKFGRIDILI